MRSYSSTTWSGEARDVAVDGDILLVKEIDNIVEDGVVPTHCDCQIVAIIKICFAAV